MFSKSGTVSVPKTSENPIECSYRPRDIEFEGPQEFQNGGLRGGAKVKIVGIILQRNELDVILFNILHHLETVGFDEIIVGDNGSTDGSFQALQFLAAKDPRLRVISMPGDFDQARRTNELFQVALGRGADWVCPLDADEFIGVSKKSFRNTLTQCKDPAVELVIRNFVQNRRVQRKRMWGIFSMVYVARPLGAREEAQELVTSGKIGFVEMAYPPKYIWRADPGLIIHKGNHGSSVSLPSSLPEIYLNHVPMRQKSSVAARAKLISRIEKGSGKNTSWHLRRLADIDVDEEWRRNSARFGAIDVSGTGRYLILDLFFAGVFIRHAVKVRRLVLLSRNRQQ